MTNTQADKDMQFQIEHLTQQLVIMLMENYGMSMEKAMHTVYGSHTYEKIENANTGLYYQSPVYVMDMLQEELGAALLH